MAERRLGPYQLIRPIAVGGMAEIHLAKTRGLGGFEKLCALKVIHPNYAEDEQFISMLVDEAKLAVQLQHANIAQTFDLGRAGEVYYIAMELVDGIDLYRLLRRGSELGRQLPIDVAAYIAKEIATGLDYAHRKKDGRGAPLGIVHRDVSPQNVLVSYAGEVKLVDFGIAQATMKARQTAAGVIKGKYYYMSPEQAAGERLDARSDIFSIGIVLYELLTGQMLYLEDDLHKLLAMVRRADIPPLRTRGREVPGPLETIVMRALAKQPGSRYQSAGDLAADLERFLHGYAPSFSAAKLAAQVRAVFDAAASPSGEPDGRARLPLPVDPATILTDRSEIAYEHSVLRRRREAAKSPSARKPPLAPPADSAAGPRSIANVGASAPPRGAPLARLAEYPTVPASGGYADDPELTLSADPPEGDELTSLAGPRGAKPAADDGFSDHEPTMIEDRPGLHSSGQQEDDPVTVARDPAAPGGGGPVRREPPPAPAANARVAEPPPRRAPPQSPVRSSVAQPAARGGEAAPRRSAGNDAAGRGASSLSSPGGGDNVRRASPAATKGAENAVRHATPDRTKGPNQIRPAPTEPTPPAASVARRSSDATPPASERSARPAAASAPSRPRSSRRTPVGGLPAAAGTALPAPTPTMPKPARGAGAPISDGIPGSLRDPARTDVPTGPAPRHEPPRSGATSSQDLRGLDPAALDARLDRAIAPELDPRAPRPTSQAVTEPGFDTLAARLVNAATQSGPTTRSAGVVNAATEPAVDLRTLQMTGVPFEVAPTLPGAGLPTHILSEPIDEHGNPIKPYVPPQHALPFNPESLGDTAAYKLQPDRRWWWRLLSGLAVMAAVAGGAVVFIQREQTVAVETTLLIESSPPGATVQIDGEQLFERTPARFATSPGSRHSLHVTFPGHTEYRDDVVVPASGGQLRVYAFLPATPVTLRVVTVPPGAEVYIGNQVKGRTPLTINDLSREALRTIEVRHKDYLLETRSFDWTDKTEQTVEIKLRR